MSKSLLENSDDCDGVKKLWVAVRYTKPRRKHKTLVLGGLKVVGCPIYLHGCCSDYVATLTASFVDPIFKVDGFVFRQAPVK